MRRCYNRTRRVNRLWVEFAFSSKREPPRGKPVASKEASSDLASSNKRETPPDKPVALKSFQKVSGRFGPMLTFRLTIRMISPFPIERDAKIESDVGKVKSYDTSEL